MRFFELAEAIPEKDMMETGRFRWIAGYALSAVLLGSYEHHEEHLESLLDCCEVVRPGSRDDEIKEQQRWA